MIITVSDLPITGKHYSFDFKNQITPQESEVGSTKTAILTDSQHEIPGAIDPIEHYDYLQPVHFEGEVYKSGNDVRIQGRVTTQLKVECARCLEIFAFPIDSQFEVFYRPHPHHSPKESDVPFGELGILHYKDNQIDLAESVRDTIILEIPIRLICKEDCLGLCQHCGKNLNQEKCSCTGTTVLNNPFIDFFKNHKPEVQ